MVQQSLIEYIQRLLQQGYDPSIVRNTLLNAGYPPSDVDTALRAAGAVAPRRVSSKVLIVAFLIVLVLSGGTLIILKLLQAPPAVLDISVTLFSTQVAPGQDVIVNTDIRNPGARKTSGLIDYEVSGPAGSVVSKTESFTVEMQASVPTSIPLPSTAEPGAYSVSVRVSYAGKPPYRVVKDFEIVERVAEVPKVSGEALKKEAVEAAREIQLVCPGTCDDLNFCTTDECVQGTCISTQITPCCGNNQCEPGESASSCVLDCAERPIGPDEIRNRAKEMAVSDLPKAMEVCDSLVQRSYIDLCLRDVSEATGSKEPCTKIVESDASDSCYIPFAYKNDFSVCPELKNQYIRNSCFSLSEITKTAPPKS